VETIDLAGVSRKNFAGLNAWLPDSYKLFINIEIDRILTVQETWRYHPQAGAKWDSPKKSTKIST
jgi:hypothetical protein